MAVRLPAQIPTVLALLFFVSKPTHQGREKGKSHSQGWEARLCRRGKEVDICPGFG